MLSPARPLTMAGRPLGPQLRPGRWPAGWKHPFLQSLRRRPRLGPEAWGQDSRPAPRQGGRQAFASFGPLVLHPRLRGLPGVLGVFSPKRIVPGAVGGGGCPPSTKPCNGLCTSLQPPPTPPLSVGTAGVTETLDAEVPEVPTQKVTCQSWFSSPCCLGARGWDRQGASLTGSLPLRGRDNFKKPLYLLGGFQKLPCSCHCLVWVRARVQRVPPCPLRGALSKRGGCSKPRSPEGRLARGSARREHGPGKGRRGRRS